MKNIYIGGQKSKKQNGGFKWKLYTFLILFVAITGYGLKISAPTLVEEWINRNGAGKNGYAFSIRDVDLSLEKGRVTLMDVKVFNPETNSEILEAPHLTIQMNLSDILVSQERKITVNADKVDLILSKDFSSEIERIKSAGETSKDIYLNSIDGKIGKLNIVEKKDDQSRTVLELNDVNLKVKEVALQSINKKTEFSITSDVAEGGKLNLTAKTSEEGGKTPWTIHGTLKQVPAELLNKIAGNKLPFAFTEPNLNAEINAHSEHGVVSGDIKPAIDRINLLEERVGYQTQPIKRLLSDELTFTLPFTLKDGLTLKFEDEYRKLKNYRKYPMAMPVTTDEVQVKAAAPVQAAPAAKTKPAKKSSSWWPF